MVSMQQLCMAIGRSNALRQAKEQAEQAKLDAKRAEQAARESEWREELKRRNPDAAMLAEQQQKQEAADAAWLAELETLAEEVNHAR